MFWGDRLGSGAAARNAVTDSDQERGARSNAARGTE